MEGLWNKIAGRSACEFGQNGERKWAVFCNCSLNCVLATSCRVVELSLSLSLSLSSQSSPRNSMAASTVLVLYLPYRRSHREAD
jgi:hypothetical protein